MVMDKLLQFEAFILYFFKRSFAGFNGPSDFFPLFLLVFIIRGKICIAGCSCQRKGMTSFGQWWFHTTFSFSLSPARIFSCCRLQLKSVIWKSLDYNLEEPPPVLLLPYFVIKLSSPEGKISETNDPACSVYMYDIVWQPVACSIIVKQHYYHHKA